MDALPIQQFDSALDAPCTDGMAGAYPCRDIDLEAFLPHADIGGGSGNDLWGWTDPVSGRDYVLVGRSTGTAFVDISTLSRPVYIGNLPTRTANSTWRGIKVFADHAFIVSDRWSDEVENVGFFNWTGNGPSTSEARIRVTSRTRPELTLTSSPFSIGP